MNGAHDLGGMHGFGPINAEPEAQEPVFHADWERRVFGLALAARALGKWNGDMFRFARERQHPADYLRHTYYESWLAGLETLLVETGLVSADELACGQAAGPASAEDRQHVLPAAAVAPMLRRGAPATMPAEAPPRFRPGERVRARNRHPLGHTREPRFVRGRVGVIQEYHGSHLFPDLSALGVRVGRHLYSVRFEAAELWSENANRNSAVYVDLWEEYLETVG
ncbi:MAG TPA: nitrile hydratase subunit beta [Gemmataceae bacterium]|nr:nitrile hydratase subunit beta [Gemmataceae bacterium]